MLGLLLLTVGLTTASFFVGQGVLALCGADRWRWWAPALGYAVLLAIGAQLLRVPRHATLMVAIVILACVASLALPLVRRAVMDTGLEALAFGVALLLIAAVPFFATGHTGVLGTTVSDDMSSHLAAAFYLRTGEGLHPVAALGDNLITSGYPLGTHGLAALLTHLTGIGEERAFSACMLAVPVLTGFAALGIVPSAPRAARAALAAAVALGYLVISYFAQGSFKEATQALLVLTTALALGDLAREEPPRGMRRGVPIGLLIAGSVYNYSYAGAFWLLGTAGVFLVLEIARRPRKLLSVLRAAVLPVAGTVVVAAIVIAPEITRIEQFTKSKFGVEPLTNHGNLFHAVNPLEAVGVWFSGDFRFDPRPEWPSFVLGGIAVAALVLGLVWWWRRRSMAVPAALAAALGIWGELALTVNIYNAAKGLVVIAPLAMACAGAPLAAAWGDRGRVRRTRRLIGVARVVGVLLFAGAVISTFSVLRSAPVGLGPHEQELAKMRPMLRGKRVLFLSNDHFAQWELRGARLYVTNGLYAPAHLPMNPAKGGPADVDNFESSVLDQVRFILTPAGRYHSEIPPNFRLVMRTPSYALYRRQRRTPSREPFDPYGQPGAVLDCSSPIGRKYLAQYRWAGVVPHPVVKTDWRGSSGIPGRTARIRLTLPRGRWDVSMQYVSFTGLVVRGPQLDKALAPNYGLMFAYWPAGTLTSDGGSLAVSATSKKRSWFGRLLGAPRSAISPDAPHMAPLWHVVFTRHNAMPARVPIEKACGRYVDWVAPAGSAMH